MIKQTNKEEIIIEKPEEENQKKISKSKSKSLKTSKNKKINFDNNIIKLQTSERPKKISYNPILKKVNSILNNHLLSNVNNSKNSLEMNTNLKSQMKNSVIKLNYSKFDPFLNNKRNLSKDLKNININEKNMIYNERKNINNENQENNNPQTFKIYYKCKVYCMKFILEWLNKTLKNIKFKKKLRKISGKVLEDCSTKFNLRFIKLTLKDIFEKFQVSKLYKSKVNLKMNDMYNKDLIKEIYENKEKFQSVIEILNLKFETIFNYYWKMKSNEFKEKYKFRNKYLLNTFLTRLKKKNMKYTLAIKKFTKKNLEDFLLEKIPRVNKSEYNNIV